MLHQLFGVAVAATSTGIVVWTITTQLNAWVIASLSILSCLLYIHEEEYYLEVDVDASVDAVYGEVERMCVCARARAHCAGACKLCTR